MRTCELIERFPRLFHMAEEDAWPSISAHGLLSATALCDLYGLDDHRRRAALETRRSKAVRLAPCGKLPGAVLRDQSPMTDAKLTSCLHDDLTPARWYAALNARVFFWLDHRRLLRLLGARAYRQRAHLILIVDTASLLDIYEPQVRLAAINTGSTLFVPQQRGLDTFRTIGAHPADVTPVELTVEHGVPDIATHVLRRERWAAGRVPAL